MPIQNHHYSNAGVSAEFGFYPLHYCDVTEDRFSIKTLADHADKVSIILSDVYVVGDWAFPGVDKRLDLERQGKALSSSFRIFGLPMTHALTLHRSESQVELEFVIWCLSFFTGMRLTTKDAGFLDATPLKPGKLVDFFLRRCSFVDAVQLSLDFLDLERDKPSTLQKITAIIHALFMAQSPRNLSFEQFQYLYMALDGCYGVLKDKEGPKFRISHSARVQWMCRRSSIPVPEWAADTETLRSPLSLIRNATIHEALYFDHPLGFSIYGGHDSGASAENVPLQMKALICRLLVAILGGGDVGYITSPVNTRIQHCLELKAR